MDMDTKYLHVLFLICCFTRQTTCDFVTLDIKDVPPEMWIEDVAEKSDNFTDITYLRDEYVEMPMQCRDGKQ